MSDARAPEGARWKVPDWKPFDDPPAAPPVADSPPSPAPPKMGVSVPLTAADFRDHWRELARYARLDEEDASAWDEVLGTFTEMGKKLRAAAQQEGASDSAELLDLAAKCDKVGALQLDAEQSSERAETGRFTVRLRQIETLQDCVLSMRALEILDGEHEFFAIDYTDWEDLHARGLVSPHKLSRQQLAALKGIKVFDDALGAIPAPEALRVPLSLEEIQGHWDELAPWCTTSAHAPAKLFDDIEIIDVDKGTRNPWLTAKQRSEIEARGFTYLDMAQVQRMYGAGWRHTVPVDSWFALRERGIVRDSHLSADTVRSLLSVPFFKELFDLRFNVPLIEQRAREYEQRASTERRKKRNRRMTVAVGLSAAIALGYGGWRHFLKPSQDLRADEIALLGAAKAARKERVEQINTVIEAVSRKGGTFGSIATAEEERLSGPSFKLPEFHTKPDAARFESIAEKAGVAHFEKGMFEAASKLWSEAFIYSPSSLAALHNLAYAKARMGQRDSALEIAILALSLKQEDPNLVRWKTWRLLAALTRDQTESEQVTAENVYLIAFALNKDWDEVCKTLLQDGRDFGDFVKRAVNGAFERLPNPSAARPAVKACATPAAF
jgi:tetratricopeptide (TPR) repeat protein